MDRALLCIDRALLCIDRALRALVRSVGLETTSKILEITNLSFPSPSSVQDDHLANLSRTRTRCESRTLLSASLLHLLALELIPKFPGQIFSPAHELAALAGACSLANSPSRFSPKFVCLCVYVCVCVRVCVCVCVCVSRTHSRTHCRPLHSGVKRWKRAGKLSRAKEQFFVHFPDLFSL